MQVIQRSWAWLLGLFGEVSHLERARAELDEARCSLLAEQSKLEYSQAYVKYHEARIQRLEKYLKASQNAK